jgi:threonyl-tRNA synthetase
MAMAVQRLRPGTQVTIGPWIDNGFYYDFDTGDAPLTDADLPAIKKEMQKIIKARLPIVREEVSASEAASRIAAAGEPYKQEILDGIVAADPAAPITIYHIGEPGGDGSWWDLCAGPHVPDTGAIDPSALALESVAGAYWRGDETKAMLQRVYGTAWKSKGQLKAYAALKAEAARRDHRKLGAELDLFSIGDDTGPGLVLWHPAGALVRSLIEDYWRSLHLAAGYDLLYTPHVARLDLWKTSGHYDFYRDAMFEAMPVEADAYQLRPMNCPFHIAVYQKGLRSYRDLPLRWCELGTVYRYERSGTMHGLFRVRGFTQDDGHIFCLPSQIADEIRGTLDLVETVMAGFGFNDLEVNLSTRPAKSVGSDEIWATAEAALVDALNAKGWAYRVDPGGGAFYGPKIDIKVRDALGRKWQCSTIQLDFNLPDRFGMEYVDEANARRRPIMIHRAIFGSLERFFGILVENYAGAFPLWLAPVQVRLLCVADAFKPYADEVAASLRSRGVRVRVESGERIAKLVRGAEKAKTPVMAVVGEREVADRTLAVRTYAGGDVGSLGVEEVVAKVAAAAAERREVEW